MAFIFSFYPMTRSPIMPTAMQVMHRRWGMVRLSPNKMMPAIDVPMMPIPVQTA